MALQDVTIATASLSRPAGDLGKQTTRGKLLVKNGIQRAQLLATLELLCHLGRLLRKVDSGLFAISALLDAHLDTVVGLVPRLEWVSINHHNRTLDQSLGTNKFVVGSIVSNIHDTDLAGADLGTPREVTAVQSKCPELHVASAATHRVDARLTNLGHGGRATQLELALIADRCAASTGVAALVASFTCDTHGLVSACFGESTDYNNLVLSFLPLALVCVFGTTRTGMGRSFLVRR